MFWSFVVSLPKKHSPEVCRSIAHEYGPRVNIDCLEKWYTIELQESQSVMILFYSTGRYCKPSSQGYLSNPIFEAYPHHWSIAILVEAPYFLV